MPRRSRLVIPQLPHHVTQRGSRRGIVFFCEEDRRVYLELLRTYASQYATHILAYCLMGNHVHHIMVPEDEFGLSRTLKTVHMRYASIINGQKGWTGHLWQERFYSAPLDEDYFWTAIRYVERNPVKAGLVSEASDYRWSSARAHCGSAHDPILSKDARWTRLLEQRQDWSHWLRTEEEESRINLLRNRTRGDLPCGADDFVKMLEFKVGRKIMPGPKGRPRIDKK